jgi:diketogulonate reductase-like aldo/keto reductase
MGAKKAVKKAAKKAAKKVAKKPAKKIAKKPATKKVAPKKAAKKAASPAKRTKAVVGGPTVKLASGYTMPLVGLGTWKAPAGVTGAAVEAAIKAGYRMIDTANDYNNEPEIGVAIKKCIDEGVVTREQLFVQSKLWQANHRPEHVEVDLAETLKDLQLDYVDSYIIHWPMACPSSGKQAATRKDGATAGPIDAATGRHPMFPMDKDNYYLADKEMHFVDTWKACEKLVDKGLVRSLGISNFNKRQVEEMVACATKPVCVLQNECHPYLAQKDLVDLCKFRKIQFQAFSPLGSGDTNYAKKESPTGTIPLKDAHIAALVKKYKKDAGQIMLRWALQRGTSVVSKSVNPDRVISNFKIFDWALSPQDMASFDQINCGWRHLLWGETSHHPNYPYKDELPYGYVLEKNTVLAPGQGGKKMD